MTEQERIWFRQRLKRNLEPKSIIEDYEHISYRNLVCFVMNQGLKWARYRKQKKGMGVRVYSLRLPFYSYCVPHDRVAERFIKWFNWIQYSSKNGKPKEANDA